MSNNEKNDNQEFDFSKEIESPIEVDTESISESVKAFTGPEDMHSMEEMEYYEDEESVKTEESVQSSFAKDSEGTNPDTEVDSALLNQETKVAMDTSQIIHRKGNSGVIPNLELLPTDSIRIPTDEIAETIVVPERKTVLKADQDNTDDKEASEEESYEEEGYEEESVEEAYDEESAEEEYDEEPSEEDSYSEGPNDEKTIKKEQSRKAPKKVHQDIELLPEDEIDDDVPVSKEEADALGDLSYHDEDVKKTKPNKEKNVEKKSAGGKNHSTGGNKTANHSNGKKHSPETQAKNSKGGKPEKNQKKKIGIFDILLVVGAIVAILVICLLTISFVSKTKRNTQFETLASAGNQLMSVGNIGQKGIEEIVANKTTTVVETVPEEAKSEKPSEEKKERKDVSVNFSSVEKDLKIKFSDKQTDTLIKGILFRVEARTPDGKTVTWEDSDKDGIIYMENITPGKYYVKILNVEDYVFPETESEVTVKDKISYTAINIVNEIKQEKDIDVATEAPTAKIVDTGEVLEDTVSWVDSSKKTVYTEIPKEKVLEPQAMLMTPKSSYSAEPASGDGNTEPSSQSSSETNPEPPGGTHFVTGVNVNPSSITLTVGESVAVGKVVLTDGDGVDDSVTWSSSDSGIATVDGGGNITAIAKGNATITCTTNGRRSDGSQASATCSVTVNENEHYVTGVSLDTTSVSLAVGGTSKINATVSTDGNEADTSVSFSSSDGNIVSVDSDGTITAKATGSATITVTSNGKKSDGSHASTTCSVTVTAAQVYVSSLTLDKTTASVGLNATIKLTPTAKTDTNTDYKEGFTWSTSDASIATVGTDGTVTGKAKGSATITCTTVGKNKEGKTISASCTVTVNTAMNDTKTTLTYKRDDGKEFTLYVKDGENYREAKYADYYTYSVFYIKEEKYYGWQNENGNTKYYNSEGKAVTGEQIIGGVKYNFANDGTLIVGNGIMGIDVSTYQGNIDWNAVKKSGVSFVIIRCGYRGYTKGGLIEDSKFHANASGAEAAGLKVGVYFFSQAINEREAVEEASMAITMAQRHRISYPIFIDSEYANGAHNGRADGLTKAERTAVCKAFCETVRSAGYTPGVYASKSWYYNNLDVGQLNNYKIWLAHYCTQTDYKGKYDLWQSSSKGRISGISGNVDINTSYLGY